MWYVRPSVEVNMSKTEIISKVEWETINWNKVQRNVFKLQQRIYKASLSNDVTILHKLQKLLVKSKDAKLLAVRKVCADRSFKSSPAGVDGIKFLSTEERSQLALNLKIDEKSRAAKQVWLPQLEGKQARPLKIPTLEDRAKQALLKLALEPEWEAYFEPNSYGYRPGRSPHDAIAAIYMAIAKRPAFVLRANLAPCFPLLTREKVLEKINTFPVFRRQIKAWLTCNAIDWNQWAQRKTYDRALNNVVQIITPLIANIVLHGMEQYLQKAFASLTDKVPKLVRYADDIVILCDDRTTLERCRVVFYRWLKQTGLELETIQTHLTHTLEEFNGENMECSPGFDFLDLTIRQFKTKSKLSGFTTVIAPSKQEIERHYRFLADRVKSCQAQSQSQLIGKLNPIIRNWCEERSPWNCSKVFKKLDYLLWKRLWRWATRRHPNKGKGWIVNKYWHPIGTSRWVFATISEGKQPYKLLKHSKFDAGKRWIKVEGARSPYEYEQSYWSQRINLEDLYISNEVRCKQRH
ncbi:MAG: reverse transcriptase N-terminal domain-containing protein [Prochloraceae cyanobacterium]|nr:reverse transcriptase N-terminal domain-containing protein [Prochloraceae cyanobacterium]